VTETEITQVEVTQAASAGTGTQQLFLPLYQTPLQLPPPHAAAAELSRSSTSAAGQMPDDTAMQADDVPDRPRASTARVLSRRPPAVAPAVKNPDRQYPRKIALALQGGGAHGAFTWGVLDRLLEEPGIEITAVSGSSAGALNAVALASGLLEDGRAG